MALKDKKAKKKRRPKPAKKPSYLGKVVKLDGTAQMFRGTGLNRDIPPMGGAGGSQNLLAALAARPPISGQGYAIQTPDQFNIQQDIKSIKQEQTGIAQEVAAQAEERKRKQRSDAGMDRPHGPGTGRKAPGRKPSGPEILAGEAEAPVKAAGASALPTTKEALVSKIRANAAEGLAGAAQRKKAKGQAGLTGQMQAGGEARAEYEPALSTPGLIPTSIVGDADARGAPTPVL